MTIRSVLLVMAALAAGAPMATVRAQGTSSATGDIGRCALAQVIVARMLDAAAAKIETGRQTNSAAAMRAALSEFDTFVRDLRLQLEPCNGFAAATDAHAGHSAAPSSSSLSAPPADAPTLSPLPAAAPPSVPAVGAPPADQHAGHTDTTAASTPPGDPAPTTAVAAAPVRTSGPREPVVRNAAPSGLAGTSSSVPASDPHAGHSPVVSPAPARGRGAAPPPSSVIAARPTPPASNGGQSASSATTAHAGHTPAAAPAGRTLVWSTRAETLKCGTGSGSSAAPRTTYRGTLYYFCSERDRQEFLKDPARFMTAAVP